jgi:ribosome-binding factor A
MTTIRQQRVANLLFEELSILISNELADPRLHLVSVTNVVVSRDLRNVKVFVHHQDEESTPQDVLRALGNATAYMRMQIAQRAGLRITPELLFYYDDTPAKAARIDELLNQIADERNKSSKNEEGQEND